MCVRARKNITIFLSTYQIAVIYYIISRSKLRVYQTRRSWLDITVAGSPSPAASEDEEEGASNAASNHAGNHRSNHSSARKGRQKRGVLPKHATSIMRTWLFQHLVVSTWPIIYHCVQNSLYTVSTHSITLLRHTYIYRSILTQPKMRSVKSPARRI